MNAVLVVRFSVSLGLILKGDIIVQQLATPVPHPDDDAQHRKEEGGGEIAGCHDNQEPSLHSTATI